MLPAIFPPPPPTGSMVVSPDGQQVIVSNFETQNVYELWALDNASSHGNDPARREPSPAP